MTERKETSKVLILLVLIAGVAAMISPEYVEWNFIYGISTVIWIFAFVFLTQYIEGKFLLFLTLIGLIAGFFLRYKGFAGDIRIDAAVMSIVGLTTFLILIIYRKISRKTDNILVTLMLPVLWMALFILLSVVRVATILRVEMTLFDFRTIAQSEYAISSYGLQFLLIWSIALVIFALTRKRLGAFVIFEIILLCLLTFGISRVYLAQQPDFTIKVAYTTGPFSGDFMSYVDEDYSVDKKCFDDAVVKAAGQGASMLVFNEEAFTLSESEEVKFLENAQKMAKDNDIRVLVGIDLSRGEGRKSSNKIVWVDNHGEIKAEYAKRQTIPIMEDAYERGNGEIPVIEDVIGNQPVDIGFAICFDSNFSYYIKQIKGKAQVLILPSWDWDAVTESHARICGMIAVENGVTIIKPTYDGITIAADPYGNVVHRSDTKDTGFETVQVVELPVYGKVN